MSGSDRGGKFASIEAIFPAIGIIAAVGFAWGLGRLEGAESQRHYDTPRQYEASAKQRAERACIGREPAAVFECVSEYVESAAQSAHDEQDLIAQQRGADSALSAAIFTGLTLLVSVLGVFYVKRTLEATLEAVEDTGRATNAMIDANEIAREAMQRERAWIKIEDVRIKWVRFERADNQPNNPEYFQVNIEVDVKNVGTVPAVFVQSVPMTWLNSLVEVGFNEWREHWLSALAVAKDRASINETFGHTMFPGDTRTFPGTFSTLTSRVPGTYPVDSTNELGARLFVTAIIFYQFAGSGLHYSLANTVLAIGNICDWSKGDTRHGSTLLPSRISGGDIAA